MSSPTHKLPEQLVVSFRCIRKTRLFVRQLNGIKEAEGNMIYYLRFTDLIGRILEG